MECDLDFDWDFEREASRVRKGEIDLQQQVANTMGKGEGKLN
jgi:hypothetical protein